MDSIRKSVSLTLAAFLCLLLVSTQLAFARDKSILISVPHRQQKPDFCGEACLQMVLNGMGVNYSQEQIFQLSSVDPILGRGCVARELVQVAHSLGFDPGPSWYKVRVNQAPKDLNQQFQSLVRDLQSSTPSIVCMRYDKSPQTTEHFRLVVGYDSGNDDILYMEPAGDDPRVQRMSRETFLELWPLKYDSQEWTLVRLRLDMGRRISKAPQLKGFSKADYALHVRRLKRRLPHPNFHIVIQEPFVVVGDEDMVTVEARSQSTVAWAVSHLKRSYFPKDPQHIIDIWLFKDRQSYQSNALKLFSSRPSTPYGYYSPRDKALVMNISTGGGTLVHEIVHPFMETNFPKCPDWFNEGLASLYEQCGERRGQIVGQTNWRLPILQDFIQAGELQSIATLGSRDFYGDDDGSNYAMARYLCYYLQEKGKLRQFYRLFRHQAHRDPKGLNALRTVLGTEDLKAFQQNWERYILTLKF